MSIGHPLRRWWGGPRGTGPCRDKERHLLARDEFQGPGALARLVLAALRLDPLVYARVAGSPEATHICLAVAAVSGVGRALAVSAAAGEEGQRTIGVVLMVCVGAALLSTLLDSLFLWGVGRLVLRRTVPLGAVLRPVALACAPSLIRLLAGVGEAWIVPVGIAAQIWILLALVVAVRGALSTSWIGAAALALATAAFQIGLGVLTD